MEERPAPAEGNAWWVKPRLREDAARGVERRVGWLELFYDLVFVVVVAELSHKLAGDASWPGVGAFVLLFFPAFWMWIGGTIYTERFETDDLSHRLSTFLQMLAVGAMAAFVHDGTGATSRAFALSYASGRALICVLWWRGGLHDARARPVTDRYVAGFSVSVVLFAASVLVASPARFAMWGIGLLVDLATPVFAFRHQPRLPPLSRHRLLERFGLFVMIVLGEAVVAVVHGLAEQGHPSGLAFAAAAQGMAIVFCVWWLYYDLVGRRGPRPGLSWSMARNYLHFPLLAGITATAAGIVHVLEDPGHVSAGARALLAGALAATSLALAALHVVLDPAGQQPRAWRAVRVGLLAVAALGVVVAVVDVHLDAAELMAALLAVALLPIVLGTTMWAKGRLS